MTRADRHNNPTAFTTDLAKQAGLTLGVDYELGDPFPKSKLRTAKILGNPLVITRRLIGKVGFQTKSGAARWTYINMPMFVWDSLSPSGQNQVIFWMYQHEGGTELKPLFA